MEVNVDRRKERGAKSDAGSISPTHHRQRVKKEVCEEIYRKLVEDGDEAVKADGFMEELQAHFNRLPTRYALDVNTERGQDVLMHKRLLEMAAVPENRPAFFVRAVYVYMPGDYENTPDSSPSKSPSPENTGAPPRSGTQSSFAPPPAFGSSPNLENLEALSLEAGNPVVLQHERGKQSLVGNRSPRYPHLPMHEVTFSTLDKPKLLSQLSTLLNEVKLNIREAHVFSTVDGYSLDVFVVDGWATEESEDLQKALQDVVLKMERAVWSRSATPSPMASPARLLGVVGPVPASTTTIPLSSSSSDPAVGQAAAAKAPHDTATTSSSSITPATAAAGGGGAGHNSRSSLSAAASSDGSSDWEIDPKQLKLLNKVASGSFGDLYRGLYCGQDVAIKILKPERLNDNLQSEFKQEVSILRKVRHKNVVQFIGACTKPPDLSIVTEFMVGGSVYDYLHKLKVTLKLQTLLKVAIDVSKGMDYLHHHNIIHRDLKAANLLMDENEVVKVADFGVARVQDKTAVMTAETGTYRWMAPEVIEHKKYDHKADMFSFGVVLWELLTGRLPYSDLTPLQAAVGVVQRGLRPPVPKGTHPRLADLMQRCWRANPADRPEFSEITKELQDILKTVEAEGDEEKKKDKKPGFFSALKRSGSSSTRS